jgi:FKBP-type peptidyl-prolyl cis-trans isomerase (trigger factor)
VTEEELQAEVRSLAQANNVSEAALGDMIRQDEERRGELLETLLHRKTVDFLIKKAIIG